MAGTKEGKILATRFKVLADHGYTDASANPSKFNTGLFSIATGSYDYGTSFMEAMPYIPINHPEVLLTAAPSG